MHRSISASRQPQLVEGRRVERIVRDDQALAVVAVERQHVPIQQDARGKLGEKVFSERLLLELDVGKAQLPRQEPQQRLLCQTAGRKRPGGRLALREQVANPPGGGLVQ
jgi:hypothetical protein